MIDESCRAPRENLDDGFNPCRKQVVENGELCQYAHMYDVMNERYDREDETSYLDWAKRNRITQSTPSQTVGSGKLYAQDAQGVDGFVKSSGTLDPTTNAEIPSSKAVADYVSSQYLPVNSILIPPNSDLNEYKTPGKYAVEGNSVVPSIINTPINITKAFNIYVFHALTENYYIGQQLTTYDGSGTYYRFYSNSTDQWYPWTLLYPTPSSTIPNKFYYAVSPFPSDTWEGEMTINVTPVFSVNIGAVTYVIARVYGYKRFNYTGTADYINLFTRLKPVGDYTGVFSGSTRIPLTFDVFGRSNTDGTYGLTPKGSVTNLSLNSQTVSSVFDLGNFDITSNLKCVFGEGTNTPGVTVSVDCIALMWNQPM